MRYLGPLLALLAWAHAYKNDRPSAFGRVKPREPDDRTPIKIGSIFPVTNIRSGRRMYLKYLNITLDDYNDNPTYYPAYKDNHFRTEHNRDLAAFLPSTMFPMEVLETLCDMMIEEQVAVIIYIFNFEEYGQSTASAQYLLHLASFTGIPIVAWNADNSGILVNKDLNEYHILQTAPPIEHQVQAMLQILERYKWNKFAIVTSKIAGHENFIELVRAEEMIEERSFRLEIMTSISVDVKKNDSNLIVEFNKLKQSEARIFLLYATQKEAEHIFNLSARLGLTDKHYMWIGTQSIIGSDWTRKAAPDYQLGMLAIHFHTQASPYSEDGNCIVPQIQNAAAIVARGINEFIKTYNTSLSLMSTSSCENDAEFVWPTGDILYKYLKAVRFEGVTGDEDVPKIEIQFDDNGKLRQSLLHILNLNMDRRWDKVGTYIGSEGLQITDMTWPGNQPSPPAGTPEKFHLKIVTLDEQPFMIPGELDPETGECPGNQGVKCDWGTTEEIEEETGDVKYVAETGPAALADQNYTNGSLLNHTNTTVWKCCTGYCVDLLNKLSVDIGFTYELYKVADGKWGLKTQTGWNGLIKDLVDRKADMCATSIKINSQRAKDIDFSVPFLETGIAIMVVGLFLNQNTKLRIAEPFEYSTWVFILIISIQACAVAIFIFEWVSPDSYNMSRKPPPGHKFSLFRALWLVWATLFSASVNTDVPRSYTSRFVALVWAAFAVTFLAVYTGNLVQFMITRSKYYDLSGIDDPKLTNPREQYPRFTYGTVEGGNTHETLKRNYRKLHDFIADGDQKKGVSYFQQNVSEGIKAIKEERLHAFIYDAVVLDYLAGKDGNCELLTVGDWFSETGYGFGFPKNSKYLAQFNEYMLLYQQQGVLERLQNFWLTGACDKKTIDVKTHSVPARAENFISAFVLLYGGTVLGLIILGLEWIYCIYLRKKLMKIDKNGWCGLLSMSMGKSLSFGEAAQQMTKAARDMTDGDKIRTLRSQLRTANERIKHLETTINEHKNNSIMGLDEDEMFGLKREESTL